MSTPVVKVNGQSNYADFLPLSTSVTLGVLNAPVGATYTWSIIDQPPNVGGGSQAVLSSTSVAAPTFTPSNEGSYLVQCVLNQGLSTAVDITGLAIIRQIVSGERVPAANETIETDGMGATEPGAGWAVSANSFLRRLDKVLGDPGVIVGIAESNGLAVGDLVTPGGSSSAGSPTGPNGLTYPGFVAAVATSTGIAFGQIGVVVGSPSGGAISSVGDFIQVRWQGLYRGIAYTGTFSSFVGSPVYATNSGVLDYTCVNAGTYSRVIGVVGAVNTTAKTFDVFMAGGTAPGASGGYSYGFTACLAAFPATGGIMYLPAGTYKLATNLVIPENVSMSFAGAVIAIANGITLTINSQTLAPSTAQIFSFYASPSATPVVYNAGPVSPMWWGATGNGSTDDTAAIAQCFAGCSLLEVAVPSDDVEFVVPEIRFPARQFNVSSVLELPYGAWITGEGEACLYGTSSTNDILTSTGAYFRARIDGLTLVGGQNCITITGNDLDMDTIYITRCGLFGAAAALINANRASTQIVIDQCNLRNVNSGGNIVYGICDEITLIDCWVNQNCTTAFYVSSDFCMLRVTGVTSASSGEWINAVNGCQVYLYQTRFGGENGGQSLLYWANSTTAILDANLGGTSSPQNAWGQLNGQVVVQDCNCYSASQFIINFQDLPGLMYFEGNSGFADSTGVHFDSSIPLCARAALGYGYPNGIGDLFIPAGGALSAGTYIDATSDPEIADRILWTPRQQSGAPASTDLLTGLTGASFTISASGGITSTATTNLFGTAAQSVQAVAAGGYGYAYNQTALSGLAAGTSGVLQSTTIAAGSNGVNATTFTGSGTLHVANSGTTGFPTSGVLIAVAGTATVAIAYTGTTSNTFTGCTTLNGGAGVFATSASVYTQQTAWTVVYDILISSGCVYFGLSAGESGKEVELARGQAFIHLPFWWNPARVNPAVWQASTVYAVGAIVISGAGGVYAPYAVWQALTAGTSAASGGPGSVNAEVPDGPGCVYDGQTTTYAGSTINVNTLTGTQTLALTSASGMPSAGTVRVAITTTNNLVGFTNISYTSIVGNVLHGCTNLGAAGTLMNGYSVFQGIMWAWCGNQTVTLSADEISGNGTVQYNSVRIFQGRPLITTSNTIATGTGAPATGNWFAGDQIIITNPVAGGWASAICTTAGSQGTWKALNPISA
jgi:hypothetical protein